LLPERAKANHTTPHNSNEPQTPRFETWRLAANTTSRLAEAKHYTTTRRWTKPT